MINKNILFWSVFRVNMIEQLLTTFSNYSRSLEVLYLLRDVKKSVRLDANKIELEKIKNFCAEKDLHLGISDFKLIKAHDEGKGGFANIVKRVPIDFQGPGLYHLYLSKDKNIAKFLKLMESKNDDEIVGKLLGYPQCCIDFFLKNKGQDQNDYVLPALENSNGFKFSFYTNNVVRYFDVTLFSHFPCNFNCNASMKIANKNLELIKEESKEIAVKFEEMLKSTILYTERRGIFVFKNSNLNGNILEYNDVKSTINNELLSLLNESKKIEIINKNKVKIKDETMEKIGFMVFS